MKAKIAGLICMAQLIPQIIFPAEAADLKNPQQKLKVIQQNKTAKEQQIDQLQSETNKIKAKLQEIEKKTSECSQRIAENEKQLPEKQQQLKQQRDRFRQIMVQTYKKGDAYYMKQLISVDSFSEFLVRLETVRLFVRQQQRVFHAYLRLNEEIEMRLAMLNKEQKQQGQYLKEAEQEYQKLSKLVAARKLELEKIEEEEELTKEQIREIQQAHAKNGAVYGTGSYCFPVPGGRLRPNFMERRGGYAHKGVDILAPSGTPIRAVDAGEVVLAKSNPGGFGYYLVIDHGKGIKTLYGHMYQNTVRVHVGQRVYKGQIIAEVGCNGQSTAPHLHLEFHVNGSVQNPVRYLR